MAAQVSPPGTDAYTTDTTTDITTDTTSSNNSSNNSSLGYATVAMSQRSSSMSVDTASHQPPPPPQLPHSANRMAQIFQHCPALLKQSAVGAGQRVPRLDPTMPLSLFYHADYQMRHAVKKLHGLQNPHTARFHRGIDKVHQRQRMLLDTMWIVYEAMPASIKAQRDFRSHLPAEDQRELAGCFCENILFAAEALSRDFRIRGIDGIPPLRESARRLCAAFEATRIVLRHHALSTPHSIEVEALAPVFQDFDEAWVDFEHSLCYCYFAVASHLPYDGTTPLRFRDGDDFNNHGRSHSQADSVDDVDKFAVLLSETVLHGLTCRYFSRDDLEACEPYLMFAIPRLAVVVSLVHMPDFSVPGERHILNDWLPKPKSKPLASKTAMDNDPIEAIRGRLRQLDIAEICWLEKLLVNNHHSRVNTRSASPVFVHSIVVVDPSVVLMQQACLHELFTDIAAVSDALQTGPRAKDFSRLMGRVFKMHFTPADVDAVGGGGGKTNLPDVTNAPTHNSNNNRINLPTRRSSRLVSWRRPSLLGGGR